MTLSAWSTPRPSPTALLLSTLMWELLLLLLASVQGTGLGTKGTPVDPDRSGLTGPNGRRIPKVIQEPAMHHLLISEVHDFLVDVIGLQPHQMCSHEGRRPSPRNRGLLEQQIVQNHVPMDQLQIRCYCHWSSNGPHGSLCCYSYMLSEQWGPLIFCCKGMHYRRSHCITVDAIPRRGNLNVRTVIIRHPVSGTLGKQTCSELTQSVKHWEAQTPLSKVKIPLEKVPLLTQLPGKAGGITDPHTAKRFTRMRVWLWNWSTHCAGVV